MVNSTLQLIFSNHEGTLAQCVKEKTLPPMFDSHGQRTAFAVEVRVDIGHEAVLTGSCCFVMGSVLWPWGFPCFTHVLRISHSPLY